MIVFAALSALVIAAVFVYMFGKGLTREDTAHSLAYLAASVLWFATLGYMWAVLFLPMFGTE